MKRAFFAALAFYHVIGCAQAQTFTADDLSNRTIQRRAVEAVIWGMPAVNYDLMFQAMVTGQGRASTRSSTGRGCPTGRTRRSRPTPTRSTSCRSSTPRTRARWCWRSRRQATARSPAASTMLADGAGGCRAGRRRQGQGRQISDPAAGLQGQGAGRLHRPASPLRISSYAFLRSNLKSGSDADIAKAVAYGKRVKLYPLSQAANPPPTTFVDAIDVVFDAPSPTTCASSSRSTASCREPWLERDQAMIDMLKSIGIEKGKPFDPDPRRRRRF